MHIILIDLFATSAISFVPHTANLINIGKLKHFTLDYFPMIKCKSMNFELCSYHHMADASVMSNKIDLYISFKKSILYVEHYFLFYLLFVLQVKLLYKTILHFAWMTHLQCCFYIKLITYTLLFSLFLLLYVFTNTVANS